MGDEERKTKQVICMRTDLNMRKGKMVAQGAHASLGAMLLLIEDEEKWDRDLGEYGADIHIAKNKWLNGTFTKICVGVESEDELMAVYKNAMLDGLPVKLIVDSGRTEFHGQPTKTCLAIGPCWADQIDAVTGDLTLL